MKERMRRSALSIALSASIFAIIAVPASSAPGSASKHGLQSAQVETGGKTTGKAQETAGEMKFHQNCSRCHKAPQSFPPSISGTILMHMRVRASLSQQDERDILRFLNP